MKNFGAIVKATRLSMGMTQSDLAKAASMPNSQLCTIELGRTSPSVIVADRIAEALGMTLAELLGTKGAKKRRKVEGKVKKFDGGDFISIRENEPDFEKALKVVKGAGQACWIVENIAWATMAGRGDIMASALRSRLGAGMLPFADLPFVLRCAGVAIEMAKLPITSASVGIWNVKTRSFTIVLNKANTAERNIYRLAYEVASVNVFANGGFVPFADEGLEHRVIRDFAAEFLMPRLAMIKAVESFGIGRKDWTMEVLCQMKLHFGVSAESFALRLEELGLIEPPLREALRDKIRAHYAAYPNAMEPMPKSYNLKNHK